MWRMLDRVAMGRVLSQSLSFPCQYHSTIAPYSFIHLPLTLYNVFLLVLQFSPVSVIPPLLHTHPSTFCCYLIDKVAKTGNYKRFYRSAFRGNLCREEISLFFVLNFLKVYTSFTSFSYLKNLVGPFLL